MKYSIQFAWITGMMILFASGCASSASNLKPDAISADEGAFFGRITIVNQGEDVTSHCYANFTTPGDKRKAFISLDNTGWVFASAQQGATYLSLISCTLGGLVKYNAAYVSSDLKFEIAGKGTLVYFGDVRIDLNYDSSGVVAATVFAGAVGNAVASSGANNKGFAVLEDRFADAEKEYRRRFEGSAGALKPVTDLAAAKSTRIPASGAR